MGKSSDKLINFVQGEIDAGRVRKVDIQRRAGMSASVLDAYLLRRSVPGMDAADRLAEAAGTTLSAILGAQGGGVAQDPKILVRHAAEEAAERVLKQMAPANSLPADVAALARDLAALDEDKRHPLMAGFTAAVEYQLSLANSRKAAPKRQKQS